MALLWPKDGPHMVLQIGTLWIIINVPREAPCQISQFWVYPIVPLFLEMAKIWPFNGKNMVLQIESSWILINLPRVALCQISHYRMYTVIPFPKNGKSFDLDGPKMVLKWSFILVLADSESKCPGILHVKFEICGCKLQPPFLEQAKIWPSWPKHSPHIGLKICSSWILINVPRGCSMPNFTLLGVSCSPLS